MDKKRMYRKIGRFFLFVTLNLLFSVGIVWLAYHNRVRIKRWMDHENSFSKEDKVIMYDIFSSPLIDDESDLFFPPVKNSNELINYLHKSTLPDGLDLRRMYDSCRILGTEKYKTQVLRIRYLLFNDTLESFVYFKRIGSAGTRTNAAVLYISGSGDNRTTRVALRQLENEDPTLQAEQIHADIYFPVFPADDILAIHDGTKMLDVKKISSYLVAINRSLSLRYLANIFALEKYLRNDYRVLHTWGHSRGGATATVAAEVFSPDTLIVSSGYSVISDKFFRLGPDQLWWSGAHSFTNRDSLKNCLSNAKTKSFFLFGRKEEDIYGLECKYFHTEKFFKNCPNIKVKYADKGHVWFSDDISDILAGKISN